MEDVLDVYHRPYDERRPLVCLDEASKQLIGEVAEPIPAEPGQPERYDYECEVTPDRTGLLLGKLTSPRRAVRTAGAPREQDSQRLAAITSISAE